MGWNFLQYLVVTVALALILGHSSERELRPSDHGLAYQEGSSPPAPKSEAKQIRAFFGGATQSLQLPEARNVSDSWWAHAAKSGGARDSGKGHVIRLGLLVASGVCGVVGFGLLVVSGAVYLRRLRKQQPPKGERIPSTSAPTLTI